MKNYINKIFLFLILLDIIQITKQYTSILKKSKIRQAPLFTMKRAKRTENIFNINKSYDDISFNKSLSRSGSANSINNKILKRKKSEAIYLTGMAIMNNNKEENNKKNFLSNNIIKIKPFLNISRAQSSHSDNSIDSKIKKNDYNRNKNKEKIIIKRKIPFNMSSDRDCGQKFILNNNPGVGMYNVFDSILFILIKFYNFF